MGDQKKRKAIDLATKIEIIEKVEAGKKQVKIAEDYGLKKQTVSSIIAAKEKVREAYQKNAVTNKRKKIRHPPVDSLEKALEIW